MAPRPVGIAVLFGLITSIFSHYLFWIFPPAYQWFTVVSLIPGFYLLLLWINFQLKSIQVIQSDDSQISRKLQVKLSYSESFSRCGGLAYLVSFLLITISGNLITIRVPKESGSICNVINLIDRLIF